MRVKQPTNVSDHESQCSPPAVPRHRRDDLRAPAGRPAQQGESPRARVAPAVHASGHYRTWSARWMRPCRPRNASAGAPRTSWRAQSELPRAVRYRAAGRGGRRPVLRRARRSGHTDAVAGGGTAPGMGKYTCAYERVVTSGRQPGRGHYPCSRHAAS